MIVRILIGAAIVVVALVVAWLIERRRPEAPPRSVYPVPRQLNRQDFPRPDSPWLVALFSSTTCDGCEGMAAKMAVLESADVAIADVEFHAQRDLHQRYEISGIPMTVVADAEGVVRAAFVGQASATDLWAAVAECRVPGTTPEPELGALD